MDWDTGFLADPKFQHLRDLTPDPIQFGYAGFCYLRLAADAWRTTERHPISKIVRGIEDWAVIALTEAGLLDDQGMVTHESFEKWVGAALEGRRDWRIRQRTHRESQDVTVTGRDSPPARAIGTVGRDDRVGTIGTTGTRARGGMSSAAEVTGGFVGSLVPRERP